MTTFVKSLESSDYTEIVAAVDSVRQTTAGLTNRGVRIDIPHTHRFWEYGSAIAALESMFESKLSGLDILDIGSGNGALGPTLSYMYHANVTEIDPDVSSFQNRLFCNKVLSRLNCPQIFRTQLDLFSMHEKFDAVFCISVLEHIPRDKEMAAWVHLTNLVKPGGLLFITVDCVPRAGGHYVMDNLRETNYTTELIANRVQVLCESSCNMTPMGQPDYAFHGAEVFDYTFFRIGLIKNDDSESGVMQRAWDLHRNKANVQ